MAFFGGFEIEWVYFGGSCKQGIGERERERERERECGVREEEGISGGGDDAGKQRPSQVAVGISTF